jgi:hypothetical protein
MPVQQTSICVIANNRITVNGQTVFDQAPDLDFTAFAKAAFKNLNLAYPKFYKMDRLCKLGFLAAEYLLSGDMIRRPDESTAIVLCNSSSSLDSDLTHLQNAEQPSPAVFVYTLPNIVAGEIAIRHGIKGETAFFISERDDDPVVRQYTVNLLENGAASSCIAGWVDYADEQYLAKLYFLNTDD